MEPMTTHVQPKTRRRLAALFSVPLAFSLVRGRFFGRVLIDRHHDRPADVGVGEERVRPRGVLRVALVEQADLV